MKIVHLTSLHNSYDIRIFHKQCKSLSAHGYDVTLVVKATSDEIIDGVKILGISEEVFRLKRFFYSSWAVYDKAIQSKARICHFHDPELIPMAILLVIRGRKVIYDVHEDLPRQILGKEWIHPWLRYPVSWFSALVEWIGSRVFFAGIVPATPKISNRFPRSKTVLVQNYPMIDELAGNQCVSWLERENQIIYIGGIDGVRGAIENIKALELVKNRDFRLLLAGPFSSDALEQECRDLKGWRYVDYHSWLSRKEVKDKLSKSKIGLCLFHPLPNHIDAQPNKMFEYMSAGIPVVVSDFPLWRQIVETVNCGLLVDPLDPEEIAKAIDWLLEHPQEAKKMGKNGQIAVKEKYNWFQEERKLLALYSRMANS